MSFLQSLFGSPPLPEEPEPKPTINLPEDEYTVAYPVAVRESQIDAFHTVIEAERETPYLDGPGADFLLQALDEAWKNSIPDDETWQDILQKTRSDAEQIITAWKEIIVDEIDVVFLPITGAPRLERFLFMCESRADNDEDPFTLPDEFVDAVSLLNKLRTAEDSKESVLVHKDQLPSN